MLYDRKGLRVFVYREEIDMRYGFERLHSLCVQELKARMDQGHLYVFFGRNRRRLKILWFDGTGLLLATKRMEKGSFMSLSELLGRSEISHKELELILHGSVIRSPMVERSGVGIGKSLMTQRESVALPQGFTQTSSYGSANPPTP
ncbi:MAG: IS66 family insertion sequence element accessory protein TnpB [Bdellovibrionaceae bacterium]|nr:IS66 family insertion sequence element accessory protein TnpB [Bdellovibrionales bacterium]MCB9085754.1 IS66 family insertion sequence element accessory protein TnpB [Pseudobdellovibrionaceae bacterium]